MFLYNFITYLIYCIQIANLLLGFHCNIVFSEPQENKDLITLIEFEFSSYILLQNTFTLLPVIL